MTVDLGEPDTRESSGARSEPALSVEAHLIGYAESGVETQVGR